MTSLTLQSRKYCIQLYERNFGACSIRQRRHQKFNRNPALADNSVFTVAQMPDTPFLPGSMSTPVARYAAPVPHCERWLPKLMNHLNCISRAVLNLFLPLPVQNWQGRDWVVAAWARVLECFSNNRLDTVRYVKP